MGGCFNTASVEVLAGLSGVGCEGAGVTASSCKDFTKFN